MNILVTGAAGFIGSHLCRALLKRGDRVVGLDNFDPFYPRPRKENNLAFAAEGGPLEFVEGDIRNAETLDRCLEPYAIDAVIHLAALAGVQPSLADPLRYQDVNINGTAQIMESMRRHSVKKLVFASSSSVYGDNPKIPFQENDPVDNPISPYAATKKAGELLAHVYHHLFGFDIHCLRFFTVYGPRQRPDLAIRKFAELMAAGRPVTIYGDGSQSRDFTFIDDIVSGVLASLDNLAGYRVYNLGRGQTISVLDLVEQMGEILGVTPDMVFDSRKPGDVVRTYADISLAGRELGYCPAVDIPEGLKRFLDWLRPNSETK
jgi:UDP-glucuronate 4-epimerase